MHANKKQEARRKEKEFKREGGPHDVSGVFGKFGDFGARLNVPEHAGHVTGAGDDLRVAEEAAAREITNVGGELATRLGNVATKVEDGANVFETTAGNHRPGGREGTRHDPDGAQRDGVEFVCCQSVPDDEFAVHGGAHEACLVLGPLHGVDFREMALQRPARLDGAAREAGKILCEGLDFFFFFFFLFCARFSE